MSLRTEEYYMPADINCGTPIKIYGRDCQNLLYAYDSLKYNLPTALTGKMDFLDHTHETRLITGNAQLAKPRSNTVIYGSKSIENRSIEVWNSINRNNHSVKFLEKSRVVCKMVIKKTVIIQILKKC